MVYRLQSFHADEVDRPLRSAFQESDIGLIEGHTLDPTQFDVDGRRDDDIAAGAIIRVTPPEVGNEIDESVTRPLRNNLLGLPLDLATIDLARGRDTGVLAERRPPRLLRGNQQDVLLKPYDSWVDFAGHLKHEASIINFIGLRHTYIDRPARRP